jgi:hypothetical protein
MVSPMQQGNVRWDISTPRRPWRTLLYLVFFVIAAMTVLTTLHIQKQRAFFIRPGLAPLDETPIQVETDLPTPHVSVKTRLRTRSPPRDDEDQDTTPVPPTARVHHEFPLFDDDVKTAPVGNLDTDTVDFTIVILTYKAPKSLEALLTSLRESRLLAHPNLKEVVAYFQVRTPADDALVAAQRQTAELDQDLKKLLDGRPLVPFRVIGDGKNYPVAEATFKAIETVNTTYVLYLECDRPIFPYQHAQGRRAANPQLIHSAHAAVGIVSTALRFLSQDTASVFRLQLYDNPVLAGGRGDQVLPKNTYGTATTQHCLAAPSYSAERSDVCLTAKKKMGPVFNTAYCKHWRKFVMPGKQQDLCDAFCFATWATNSSFSPYREHAADKFRNVQLYTADGRSLGNAAVEAPDSDAARVVCLTSTECNWTNQPAMYAKKWFLEHIVKPCRADRENCVGLPGRRSAVLQEQFFLKPRSGWPNARHPVCIHRGGLFYHNEVDNRE